MTTWPEVVRAAIKSSLYSIATMALGSDVEGFIKDEKRVGKIDLFVGGYNSSQNSGVASTPEIPTNKTLPFDVPTSKATSGSVGGPHTHVTTSSGCNGNVVMGLPDPMDTLSSLANTDPFCSTQAKPVP